MENGEKIIIYSWNIPKGGLPKVMLKEYCYFKNMGLNATIVTLDKALSSVYHDELNNAGTIFVQFASTINEKRKDISYFFPGLTVSIQESVIKNIVKLTKFLKCQKPRLVLAHQLLSGVIVLPFCILFRKKFVLVLHDNPFLFMEKDNYQQGSLKKKLVNSFVYLAVRLTFFYSYKVVFTSENIYRNTQKYIALKKNGAVIDYGIEIFPKSNINREFVTVVSKWSKFRNPMAYLELRKILPQDIHFFMAGRWDSEEEYLEFARTVTKAGYGDSLIIRRELTENELSELYDKSKVFVRLGFNESGTGQAILEAIGHGCPVVISKSIGASSLIREGKHGFLVEETNLTNVAQKILLIFRNNQLFEDMSNACYELAISNGWDNYLEKLAKYVLGEP